MSAITFSHGHHHRHGLGPALVALAALALGVAVFLVASRDDRTSVSTDGAAPTAPAPQTTEGAGPATSSEDAVATWLDGHRSELFPGYAEPYVGTCPTEAADPVLGLCSRMTEDLGDVQIHLVGVYATDWGADLLLERGETGWVVLDAATWPELGTPSFGAPWSPQSTIAEWWAPQIEARYGAGAVHLRSCAEAAAVADTGQPLACSTLVEDRGEQRVYESGLAGTEPDVYLLLEERDDHTWTVTRTAPAYDDGGRPVAPPAW